MKYIEEVLGVQVIYHHWKGELELPFYITERYKMRLVEIQEMKCIFLWPKGELNQMGSLKKQIHRIRMEEALPVVFVLESMDRYRRNSFIRNGIPFVVPDNQLFLPFMGIVLREKFYSKEAPVECLQPSTQLLLFYWALGDENVIYMSEAVKKLGLSAMSLTRAFRQLELTGLFETGKNGVQKYLKGLDKREEILKKAEQFLVTPVASTIYVNREEKREEWCLAGESVLFHKNKGEAPQVPCYAVNKKDCRLSGSRELLDASSQVELQLWKYDPWILARDNCVDPFSLAVSMEKPILDFFENK